jgi:ABC-type phosphate transport system substrate-binding protein
VHRLLHRLCTASAPPLHRLCTAFVPPPHCLLTACSRSSAGAIGYIDAGHGHEHGLSEVALLNKDGVYLTTKTANIGDAATVALARGDLIPTDPSADWSAVNLYNLAGPKTWPITMISYFYLEKDLSGMDAKTAALLMAFVKFVLSEEGQAKAEDKLFVKLPAAMQTYNTATLASLTLPAGYAALSVELASNTLIEVGAGVNVLSGKRREYGEWDRDRLEAQIQETPITEETKRQVLAQVSQQDTAISQIEKRTSTVVGVQMLHGAGTTNPSKLFWELLGLMTARAKFAVHATYRAVGSSTGQKEFLGASNGNVALNHFGSGDIPMTADRYSAVAAAGRTMVHVPFAVGGIGVFHSAPVGGATVDLTACVLAKIFSAQITMWDDAEIAALNAGVTLPSLPIKVVHRVKGSSSTAGFTAYMLETCPASWTLGTGSTITWPAGTNEGQGSDGMSQFIEDNEGA